MKVSVYVYVYVHIYNLQEVFTPYLWENISYDTKLRSHIKINVFDNIKF